MILNLKPWPVADLWATLFAVAVLAVLEATVFSQWVAPSAVVAGCSGATVARYLFQAGYSKRTMLGALLVTVLIAGVIGTLIFGR